MKVIDIINPSLKEGALDKLIGGGLTKLGSLLGRGSTWKAAEEYAEPVAREMLRIKRALTRDEITLLIKKDSPSVQEALERALEVKQRTNPRAMSLTVAERNAVIQAHPNPDPKLIKEIEKQATDAFDKAKRAEAVKVLKGSPIVKGAEILAVGTAWGVEAYYWKQIVTPILDYAELMEKADGYLQRGQIPDSQQGLGFKKVEDWYNYFRKQQLGIMIGKQAAMFLGGALLAKIPGKIVSTIFTKLGLPKLAVAIASTGTSAAVLKYLNGDVSDSIAKLLITEVMGYSPAGLVGGAAAEIIDGTFGKATDRAGTGGTTDKLQSIGATLNDPLAKLGGASGAGTTATQQSGKPAVTPTPAADKDATADANKPKDNTGKETPKGSGSDPAELPDFLRIERPSGDWVNIGGRRYKNKQTGDVQIFESNKRKSR
jgi:hypothetical protein